MKKMSKKIIQNFILIIGGMVISLLFFEVLCRFIIQKPQTVIVHNLNKDIASNENNILALGSPDEMLYIKTPTGLRLKRSSRAVIKNHWLSNADIEIVTNSQGYRYPELDKKKDSDYRILVLGDSITFGDFVAYEQTYPYIIETHLKRNTPQKLQGKNIQVINAGIGSIDLQNELAVLMETGLSIAPDVVLVGLYLNDAYESLNLNITMLPLFIRKSYFLTFMFNRIDMLRARYIVDYTGRKREPSIKTAKQRFLNENSISNEGWVNSTTGFNRIIYSAFDDFGYAWSDSYWQKISNIFKLMKEVSKTNGFELAVVLLPVSIQVQSEIFRNEPQQNFERLMNELNIKHLDLLPGLREKFMRDRKNLYYDHCHYTPEGNRYIGKEIAIFLINAYL